MAAAIYGPGGVRPHRVELQIIGAAAGVPLVVERLWAGLAGEIGVISAHHALRFRTGDAGIREFNLSSPLAAAAFAGKEVWRSIAAFSCGCRVDLAHRILRLVCRLTVSLPPK